MCPGVLRPLVGGRLKDTGWFGPPFISYNLTNSITDPYSLKAAKEGLQITVGAILAASYNTRTVHLLEL